MRELWKMMAFLQLLLCAYRDANPTVRSYININIFLAQVLLPHISCYTLCLQVQPLVLDFFTKT